MELTLEALKAYGGGGGGGGIEIACVVSLLTGLDFTMSRAQCTLLKLPANNRSPRPSRISRA